MARDVAGDGALDVAWAERWVRLTAEVVTEHRAELIELDRQIGDGDHGENMYRGFTAVVARLDELDEPCAQVGDVLRLVATTLMSTVGGAAGPLYGTAYLRAAKVTGLRTLDPRAVAAMIEAGLEGIVARGKARPGEKTMVDAWTPAATAGELGAVATDPMVATKGRASYLGERSAGHRDPGAVSSALVLRAAVDAAVAA